MQLDNLWTGPRRALLRYLVSGAIALGGGLASQDARATAFPSHELTIIVPFEPGANGDIIIRLLAEGMSKRLGQSIVVENKSGGGGMIGTASAARSKPDGYTMVLVANVQAVNSSLMKTVPTNIEAELRGVTLITKGTSILVVPAKSTFQTVGDFLRYAKEHPGVLSYASSGVGSTGQLTMEYLKFIVGLDLKHIPYKGGTQMYTDLVAGRVDIGFGSTSGAPELIEAGKLRGLGITSLQKMEVTGDLPPIATDVPGFEVEHWQGIMVPAATPEEIVSKLHQAASNALSDPEIRGKLERLGLKVMASSPAEFDRFVHAEIIRWADVIHKAGIRPQ